MAHFYGKLRNHIHNVKTLTGTKSRGFTSEAMSRNGKIVVELHHTDGMDIFSVRQEQHMGNGINREIACGEIGKPIN